MDNNNQSQMTQQPQMAEQPQYGQQMQYNQQMQYGQQPQYNQQMQYNQQPQYNQQMQYGQQPQYNQQMYSQPQMGYGQNMYQPKKPSKIVENAKDVHAQFKKNVGKMGLSTFCLVGIIAAMLLIVAPFMNFASLHFNEKYDDDIEVRISASDGLNLFELSKLSNTLDRVIDELNDEYHAKIDKNDIADSLDDYADDVIDEAEDEVDMSFKNLGKEAVGTVMLILRGQAALMVTPWLIIISGVGLLVFTVINNRKLKLVCSCVPVVCLLWLMFCASDFIAIMGIGAWAIVIGAVGGIVSYVKEV